MKALILRDETETAVACAQALMNKGFQVVCVENRHIARALLRIETIDLLVMDERIDGRLTHSIALSAERHNPYVNAILMTDRCGPEADELYDLLPCLYATAGLDSTAAIVAILAMSSIETYEEAEARVQQNRARAIAAQEARDAQAALEAEHTRQEALAAEAAARQMQDALAEEQAEREALREIVAASQTDPAMTEEEAEYATAAPVMTTDLPDVAAALHIAAADDPTTTGAIMFAADRDAPYLLEDEIKPDDTGDAADLPHFDADADMRHSPAA